MKAGRNNQKKKKKDSELQRFYVLELSESIK